jgi:hypothetical protein
MKYTKRRLNDLIGQGDRHRACKVPARVVIANAQHLAPGGKVNSTHPCIFTVDNH